MKTLVYFASGSYQEHYQDLPFDQVFLVDTCFSERLEKKDKVTCLGMDCLTAVDELKARNVKIDFFLSLNEGLGEGGGSYPINGDFFLGYVMPLFSDTYYHLMNKSYYAFYHNASMDLPYKKEEILENDSNFLRWDKFSKDDYHENGRAKVFKMKKDEHTTSLILNEHLKISLLQRSIWEDEDELDLLGVHIRFTRSSY